jgi:cyclopropane-fatty-acyl-phospholipid synthase
MAVMNDAGVFPRSRPASAGAGLRILRRLLAGADNPPAVRLWDGQYFSVQRSPASTLVLKQPGVLRRLLLDRDPLYLAEAYFRGALDVEGDLYPAVALSLHFKNLALGWPDKLALLRDALALPRRPEPAWRQPFAFWRRRFTHRHSRRSDRAAIRFHYDVSNEFYGLWLDAERVYSCAYFETPDDDLDLAQRQKLDHICRKLRLQPGERFLDIGCGWGALICRAAREYGVTAHGITLSREQFEFAQERIRAEGLDGQVSVALCDYRDLPEAAAYDKVASVGMIEHVGLAHLPEYFAAIRRALRPGGLFLNHGITHDRDGWGRGIGTEFINRFVFPDGELDRISNIQLGLERAGFEIHDVEGLRPHYALTLRHWVRRLEANRAAALQLVGEETYRVWRLYMAACALMFERGGLGVYQVLGSLRHQGEWPLPLTRQDVYAGARDAAS